MNIKNIYVKTLLLAAGGIFCFLAISGLFFHNHADSDYHDNCQICQWAINSVFTFLIVFVLFSCLVFCCNVVLPVVTCVSIICEANLHLRSPPPVLSYL